MKGPAVQRWLDLPPKRRRDLIDAMRDDVAGLLDLAKERTEDKRGTVQQAETVRIAADALAELAS